MSGEISKDVNCNCGHKIEKLEELIRGLFVAWSLGVLGCGVFLWLSTEYADAGLSILFCCAIEVGVLEFLRGDKIMGGLLFVMPGYLLLSGFMGW